MLICKESRNIFCFTGDLSHLVSLLWPVGVLAEKWSCRLILFVFTVGKKTHCLLSFFFFNLCSELLLFFALALSFFSVLELVMNCCSLLFRVYPNRKEKLVSCQLGCVALKRLPPDRYLYSSKCGRNGTWSVECLRHIHRPFLGAFTVI